MKLQVFAVLFLIAGASALPAASEVVVVDEFQYQLAPKNQVVDQIKWTIELISNILQGLGLDPVEWEGSELNIEIPFLLKFNAFLENFRYAGISNIEIHNLEYDRFINKLDLDVSLPEVIFEVGDSGLYINVLSFFEILDAEFRGSISLKSIRVAAEVSVDINIIGGISLRSLSINFSLGGVESDLTFKLNNLDFSELFNDFFNETVNNFFEEKEDQINKSLEIVVGIILRIIWAF
ncbi:uncharacterized protein LOC116769166 [Danaus plexippus]|uniref:uncharacterized protein LOC116769166 n=1 Tax=Danaus plexippus TaxID=13037 RepID=UPI002AB23D71|nr:uncharacterized protein LOC116769166 [Danaus plexippus]